MTDSLHNIRSAGFEDVQAISSLIKTYPDELLPRAISDIAQNIDRFLVCEKDGTIVGTVSWKILPEIGTPKNPSVEIQSLAVDKSLLRSGIGQALATEAINHVRPLHPSQVVVLTFTPPFFEKLGFKAIPKEELMHKIYMGCVNCTKYDSPFTCPETAMSLSL
jgi:amino-acid N-acetyltransferase